MKLVGKKVRRALVLFLAAVCLCLQGPVHAEILAWPFRPGAGVDIRGTYGDCRDIGNDSLIFHYGVDIHTCTSSKNLDRSRFISKLRFLAFDLGSTIVHAPAATASS